MAEGEKWQKVERRGSGGRQKMMRKMIKEDRLYMGRATGIWWCLQSRSRYQVNTNIYDTKLTHIDKKECV